MQKRLLRLTSLYSFRTNNKFDSHKNVCKNYEHCRILLFDKDTKILKYHQGENQ